MKLKEPETVELKKSSSELKEGISKPLFEQSGGFFRIIFQRQKTPQKNLTPLEIKVLAEIENDTAVSRAKIAEKLSISPDTVKEYLEKLKCQNFPSSL